MCLMCLVWRSSVSSLSSFEVGLVCLVCLVWKSSLSSLEV